MQVVKEYPDGVFSWVDLATTDTEGARAFYSGLFGWSFEENPTDSGVIYYMAQLEGYYVAGLGPLDEETQKQGAPPFWSNYVKHSDVDGIAAKAAEAGGQVLFPPMDVMEAGRMTIIQDPEGAMFGVWQPKYHIGAQLVNIPNTLTWNELMTRNMEGAQAFYSAVFGWTYQTDEGGYVAVSAGERTQAGMMSITEQMADMPPNWSCYFLTEDAEATVGKAQELGGVVMVPPTKIGEFGQFAVLADPQGAVFQIIKYDGPADPPPGY